MKKASHSSKSLILTLVLSCGPFACKSSGGGESESPAPATEESPQSSEQAASNQAVPEGGHESEQSCDVHSCELEVVGRIDAGVTAVTVAGDRLVGASGDELAIIDLASPERPILGRVAHDFGIAVTFVAATDRIAIVGSISSVTFLDVSEPSAPTVAGAVERTAVSDALIRGDLAYLASQLSSELVIMDLSHLSAPSQVGAFQATRWARGGGPGALDADGDLMVIADGFGLVTVDISDPRQPRELGTTTRSTTGDVVLRGHHAFLANAAQGLDIVSVADPSQPSLVASLCSGSVATRLAASGDTVFLLDDARYGRDRSVQVVDVANPDRPRFAGRRVLPTTAPSAVHGGVLYLPQQGQMPGDYWVEVLSGCGG